MGLMSVLAAAFASYAFGAAWYMTLSRPWAAASGVTVDSDGKPVMKTPLPFIIAFVAAVLAAGMMRHIFATSGVESFWEGLVSGFGLGLFIAAPWLLTCYAFADRPERLMLIDGGYATIGSTIMGGMLTLF